MSYFSYGAPAGASDPSTGIEISYIHTLGVDDEIIYSEDGMEYLYTKRTLRVRGIINANLPPADGANPALTLVRVRNILQTPRLQLWFCQNTKFDPNPLIRSPSLGNGVDAKNGPFPKHVGIVQVQGSECLLVELEYETYVVECEDAGLTSRPAYISHRWRETHTIDDRFYTTITRTGKIQVRADIHSNPDGLRNIVTGGIPNGFKRMKAEYTLQEDGLALAYTFTDAQVYAEPPFPSVRAEGEYTESTSEGQRRHGEVRVRLEGAKTTSRAELLKLGITIAVLKLQLAGPQVASPKWLVSGAIRESLYDNVIEVRFRVELQQLNLRTAGAAITLERFSLLPPGSDDSVPPDYGIRGTAGLKAIAAALNDPCLLNSLTTLTNEGNENVLKTRPLGENSLTGTAGNPEPVVLFTQVLPDDNTVHTLRTVVGGLDGLFSHYDLRSTYKFDDHTLQTATCQQGAIAGMITLAAPTAKKVVEFDVQRTGAIPKIPSPYELNPNMTFLYSEVDNYKMDIGADGVTPRYRISGRYYYAYTDRDKVQVNIPAPPYLDPGLTSTLRAVPRDFMGNDISSDPVDNTGTNVLRGGTPP